MQLKKKMTMTEEKNPLKKTSTNILEYMPSSDGHTKDLLMDHKKFKSSQNLSQSNYSPKKLRKNLNRPSQVITKTSGNDVVASSSLRSPGVAAAPNTTPLKEKNSSISLNKLKRKQT